MANSKTLGVKTQDSSPCILSIRAGGDKAGKVNKPDTGILEARMRDRGGRGYASQYCIGLKKILTMHPKIILLEKTL